MTKAKKLIKSSISGIGEFFLTTLIALFMTPFLIHHLGMDQYGLWMLFASFFGYYGLFEFGLGSAAQRYMSRALGKDDYEELNGVFNSSLFLFLVIGIFTLLLTVLIAWLGPLVFKKITDVDLFRKIAMMMGISLSMAFPMRSFWAIFSIHLRYDLNNYVAYGRVILRTALIIYFLLHGYRLFAFVLIMIVSDILGYLASMLLAFRLDPKIKIRFRYVNRLIIKKMFQYSVFSFIAKVNERISTTVDSFIITGFLGLEAVAFYSIPGRLLGYFFMLMANINGIVTPVFSAYEGQDNYAAIREKMLFFIKISGYWACLIAGMMVLFGKAFIVRWVGRDFEFTYQLLLILIGPMLLQVMQTPATQALYGISKHKVLSFIGMVQTGMNVLISILFVGKYGLAGVAWGTAIPMFFSYLIFIPYYVCKYIHMPIKKYYFSLGRILLFSFFVIGIEGIVVQKYIREEFCSIFLWGGICAVVYCGIALCISFSRDERGYLFGLFRNKMHRKETMLDV